MLEERALAVDDAGSDLEHRLTALVDVGDEHLGPADVVINVLFLFGIHAATRPVQLRGQSRVERAETQCITTTLDNFDFVIVLRAADNHIWQDVQRTRVAVAAVR